jgi:putative transcriptional regulator
MPVNYESWITMPSKYRSDALGALHKTVQGLRGAGLIDAKTMRAFDVSCLTRVKELSPRQIAAVRKRAGVSQAVFASYLNVTTGLVSQWERGKKHPQGPSLKLLTLADQKGLDAIA